MPRFKTDHFPGLFVLVSTVSKQGEQATPGQEMDHLENAVSSVWPVIFVCWSNGS